MDGPLDENIQNDPMQSSMVRPFERSRKNILTRRANHLRPQVTTANGNLTITATDNAKPTNFGGVYGHTLTFSEPGSNKLVTFTAADPTGLLVATPVEGDPSKLSVREYKGY